VVAGAVVVEVAVDVMVLVEAGCVDVVVTVEVSVVVVVVGGAVVVVVVVLVDVETEVAVEVVVAVVVDVAVEVVVLVVVVVAVLVDVEVEVTVVVVTKPMVNVASAKLELASVALTVCGPAEPGGTVKVAEKVDGEEVVLVIVAGDVVCTTPSYLMVIVELGAKPEPVTVTTVPGVPLVGLRTIPMVTPNGALAITSPEPKITST
jgi:hypothetical protein